MSFWPKSRYTTLLEQQITELKAEKVTLEAEIDRLRLVNHELMQKWITVPSAKPSTAVADKKELPLPKVGNWLHTLSALEVPNQIVTELDKETANGSR